MLNIGLLTSSSISGFKNNTLTPILIDKNLSIKVAIIDIRPKISLKQKIKKNIKRGRGGYIVIMALKRFFNKKSDSVNTKEFCTKYKIEVIETENPYSNKIIEKIKKYNLDLLILVGGFGIIKRPLLDITPKGVLSYHHGDMRKYRGMPPAFWELYNNENEMGVTVQILSSGLDYGKPIEEKKIKIRKNDTLKRLKDRAYKESIDMLYKALLKLSDNDFEPEVIDKFGRVYTLPNLKQWLILNIKVLWRKLNHRTLLDVS